jgi:hypothetical protein
VPGSSTSGGSWSAGQGDDDGWGPSTAVRGGSSRKPGNASRDQGSDRDRGSAPGRPAHAAAPASAPGRRSDDWSPAGPAPRGQQRANRIAERDAERSEHDQRSREAAADRPPERGLPGWAALLVLVVIAGIGGVVDTVGSIDIQGGFNIGIVAASVVAILIVKRSHMFPVVIAPPIVYTIGAGFQYYLKASDGNAQKAKLDAAANYLVYGFPAIAAASAAVLIIAGLRMITRK